MFVSDAYYFQCGTALSITPPKQGSVPLHTADMRPGTRSKYIFMMILKILIITLPVRFATELIRFSNSTYAAT